MNVLIACEFSGIVREAFRALGHNAWSCDLLPSEQPGSHHVGDALQFIRCTPYLFDPLMHWDLLIAHPPCTYLANSGVRWLYGGRGTAPDATRWAEMAKAAAFYAQLLHAKIPRRAIENPIMHRHAKRLIPRPTSVVRQNVQPWQFGHRETKNTCLDLVNLPPLIPTDIVGPSPKHGSPDYGSWARVHHASPGPERWKERSRSYAGIARAMAQQWGSLPI